jgi:hypothetical protein
LLFSGRQKELTGIERWHTNICNVGYWNLLKR